MQLHPLLDSYIKTNNATDNANLIKSNNVFYTYKQNKLLDVPQHHLHMDTTHSTLNISII
jgi:hypothetical protein